jgi:hypothetical protein
MGVKEGQQAQEQGKKGRDFEEILEQQPFVKRKKGTDWENFLANMLFFP